MLVIPTNSLSGKDYGGLLEFIRIAVDQVREKRADHIASVTIKVPHLVPLGVLETVYSRTSSHLYIEHIHSDYAVAAAEPVVSFTSSGANRFKDIKGQAHQCYDKMIATGDIDGYAKGPVFCSQFNFESEASDEYPGFPSAQAFLPRWQIVRCEHQHYAVMNFPVRQGANAESLAAHVWATYEKFRTFVYRDFDQSTAIASLRHEFELEDDASYEALVRMALNDIRKGSFSKVVLARKAVLNSKGELNAFSLLHRLREHFPSCHVFSYGSGEGASFIGATPETLLRVKEGEMHSEALAGTASRGKSPAEDARLAGDLMRSAKNINEHKVVLDEIMHRLSHAGVCEVRSESMKVSQYQNVQHLQTPIKAELKEGAHVLDIASALHPTPAVAGLPLAAAMDWIAGHESFKRGPYAGCLGWFNFSGEGELLVGIRSAVAYANSLELFAGAGIVEGSCPNDEARETRMKLDAILAHLA